MVEEARARLTLGAKLGYTVADVGFNLFWGVTSLFLLYYYTDVLGLPNATAGFIIMAALVWDGFIDPAVGIVANRTRTHWGRYRPYILWAALPLCLSFVAMFVPFAATGATLIAVTAATHLLFRTTYALTNIPYIALSAEFTSDSDERGAIAGFRMVFATITTLIVAGTTLPLATALGGGDMRAGFVYVAAVYAAAAAVTFAISVLSTRETNAAGHDVATFAQIWRTLKANRPFQLIFVATILSGIGGAMSGKMLIYFFKYNLAAPDKVTLGLTVLTGGVMLCVPVWAYISKRTSKRLVWMLSGTIGAVAWATLYLIPAPTVPITLGVLVFAAVGASGFYLSFWSMLPDTVEYGEWRTGERTEGVVFGLVLFAQKVALGIGIGLLGVLLDVIGYHANEVQSAATLAGIKTLLSLVPAMLGLAATATILFYPLDQRLHGRLVRALVRRRAGRQRTSAGA
ncbi:MFS transporter [uncultured Sphingomonas sp.]|uniref:MFS transporter n=1 Tax=uncultured Sphingomonas sp. TaxID=158754 RepID=UPI0035CBACAB